MAGSGANLYAYAGADPATFVDPTGMESFWDELGNGFTGAVDTYTFGFTSTVRDVFSLAQPNESSAAYQIGSDVGLVAATLTPGDEEAAVADELYASEHGFEVTGFRQVRPDAPQSNFTLNEPPLAPGERPTTPTIHLDKTDRHGLGEHLDVHPPTGKKYRIPMYNGDQTGIFMSLPG
jgi:hypothetical protein